MQEIIEKMKQSLAPMVLGWLLTVWMPVPSSVRSAANTAVNALRSGVGAVVRTIQTPPEQTTAQR